MTDKEMIQAVFSWLAPGGLVIAVVAWAVRTHYGLRDVKQRTEALETGMDGLRNGQKTLGEQVNGVSGTIDQLSLLLREHFDSLNTQLSDMKSLLKEEREELREHRKFCNQVLAGNYGHADEPGRMGAGEQIGKARKG